MKRITGILAAFLVAALFAGCSTDNAAVTTTKETAAQTTSAAAQNETDASQTTAVATEAETEKAADTTVSQAVTEETTTTETTSGNLTVTEEVITEEAVVTSAAQTAEETVQESAAYTAYVFNCKDTDGNPVSNVMIQICTDEMCMVATSDDNGEAIHTGDPYSYEIHVFRYPDGYELSSEQHFTVAAEYGAYDIVFAKK